MMQRNGGACHWIDGQWLEQGTLGTSIDPATGQEIGTYWEGSEDVAEKAIDAAERALHASDWAENRTLRSRVLNAMADRFEARAEELVQLLGRENGKVHSQGRFEASIVPATLRFNAALALVDAGRAAETERGSLSLTIRQPVGIAGIIAPWNSPIALVVRSLAPALAAGTTAVVMVPRQTAQVNALISEVISQTPGLPRGVVNIFTGGKAAGEAIVRSARVPAISFTGSTATGRQIFAAAAPGLKKLGLELGGKTPSIVFPDADLEEAAHAIVAGLTVFSGQFCMTASRLLVHHSIANELLQLVVDGLKAVKVGPSSDETSQMGPLIDKDNVKRVNRVVETAIADGAKVVLRGGPIREGTLSKGSFYLPTVLEVTDSKLDIVQNEVFGPVLVIERFSNEEEAITQANATPYGLAASIWSRDVNRPLRVARRVDAGTIWINSWAKLSDQFEEGGFKQSGHGRMRGLAVLEDFLETKHIAMSPGWKVAPFENAEGKIS
jgi:betaine-aldehyde dehydrogenase